MGRWGGRDLNRACERPRLLSNRSDWLRVERHRWRLAEPHSCSYCVGSSRESPASKRHFTREQLVKTRASARRRRAIRTGADNSFLPYLAPLGSPLASVRGSVVLTRPTIYLQDSTGGVEMQSDSLMPLKIGDEVEVSGEVDLHGFNPVIRKARLRSLRESVPVSPVATAANQVAAGGYDGRFVQVEGLLNTISMEKHGTLKLDLDAGTQSFHAIMPPAVADHYQGHLALFMMTRIMIIDDHPVVRAGLASMLSTQPDLEVVGSASGGLEALTLLKTITPDVILMDLHMPGMSGLDAIRAINLRPDPPGSSYLPASIPMRTFTSPLAQGRRDTS